MLMTDNNSQNWNFDEVSADDEGSDRLFIDIDSLWNMIEENPGSTENKPENLPVNIVPQGLSEIEGQSSYGAELPGSDTCSYSYNSEISDSRTRSSEGSFDSAAKSVTFDCVKQESSVQIDSPSLSGSLIDWTPKPLCYRQDIQFEIPNYPGISNFAAGATNHVSDIGGTLHPNNPKGLPHNWSMEESDISYGTYGDLSDNNSQTLGERHMEESSILNASLSSNSACHTQSSNCELPDIGSPDFLEFYNQYLHLQYSIGLESPLYISPSSNSACHTQSSNCELPDIDFPDIGSPHFLEFYNQYPHLQYSIGLESPLYISPSRQCFTENFGIQSVANNVERMANVKYQLERAGGAVTASSASSVMINSDVSGLNDNHKGADYILPSCGISTDNAEFGLTVGKASSTQILPLNLSNMPSKKQAVHMKDEKNNELCASQGIAYQSLTAIDGVAGRITSGVANGLSSKKQTFHVKDEKNYDLFAPQRTAYRSCIDVDVVGRRHSRVADGLSRKKHMFHVKDEKNEELFAAQGTAYRSCMDVDYESGRKSAGVTDGIFADKRTRQSLSSILTSISVESQAVENDERCDILIASNRTHHYFDEDETCRIISPVGNSHCQDVQASEQPCLQQSESVRRLLVSPLEDRDSNLTQSKSMGSQHSKLSCQAVQSNVLVQRSHVDDDSDVCILEDLSEPACRNQSPVNGKSHIASRSSSFIDSRSHFGGVRLKTNDERFIFRAALQDLSQPKSEATPPDGVLSVPLLRHQRIALSWMVQKETSSLYCSGGILADDQGLGKTISTIALILKERSPSSRLCTNNTKQMETLDLDADDGVTELNGTKQVAESCEVMADRSSTNCRNPSVQSKVRPAAGTLIVCPTSVLRQWSEELHNKVTREANLSVLTYHGGNRTKDPLELAKYDVILTTYAIVSMEVPKQPPVEEDDDETGRQSHIPPVGYPSTKKRKYPPSSDKRSSKSKKGDSELFESVAYPLAQVRWFRVVLDEAQSIKNHRTQVARACWGLRAKRRWCLSGTPIQNAIDDLYSYFRFLKYDPYAVFKSFCSTIKVPIQKNPAKGYRKLQAVLKTIMLRRTKGTILDGEPIINLPPKTIELKKVDFTMEERDFYCKLEADSRAQFAEYAAAGTVKQNYVNILLMLLRLRQACDHPLLVRGCGSNSMWTSSVEMVKKLPPEKQVSLLNCLEASLAICGICNDPPEDAVVASCGHVFCNQCICDHLTGDDNQCPTTNCKVRLSASLVFSRGTLRSSFPEAQESSADCSGSVLAETLEPCSSSGSFDSSKIRAALEVLQTLSRPRDLMPRTSSSITIDRGARCPENLSDPLSGALRSDSYNNQSLVLDSDTNSLVPVVGEKAIVFSQWTRMLDLLEAGLKDSSITYRRLDGTMSVVARDKAVKDFNTQPEVSVMIMSLKAASLGLNMVAACHVLLLDLWWNPTTEDQAIDRAHRIGQTRPVSVLRLTVKDTVEDRILALQQKKREMVASAFGEDETGSRQTSLTVEDLKYLFMYN